MHTPIEIIQRAKADRNRQVFEAIVLAGYELFRGDEERAKSDVSRARQMCLVDYGDGPVSIDQIVKEFLK